MAFEIRPWQNRAVRQRQSVSDKAESFPPAARGTCGCGGARRKESPWLQEQGIRTAQRAGNILENRIPGY